MIAPGDVPRPRRSAGPPRARVAAARRGERAPAPVGRSRARGPERVGVLGPRRARHRRRGARAALAAPPPAHVEGERDRGREHARGARVRRPQPAAARPPRRGRGADAARGRGRRAAVPGAQRAGRAGVRGARRDREALAARALPQARRVSAESKAALRRALREHRAVRPEAARAAAGAALARHAESLPAGTVAGFVAVRGEPPTLPLLAALRAAGRRVLLPVLREDMDLEWAEFESEDALRPARLAIPEPTGPSLGLDAIRDAELVLAPALAVDTTGGRLGQGGGSYDRALERAAAPVVAIVFDDEVLAEPVPVEPHDRGVAGVLTPGGGLRWLHGEAGPAR